MTLAESIHQTVVKYEDKDKEEVNKIVKNPQMIDTKIQII